MMLLLSIAACAENFDISGAVMVTDEEDKALTLEDQLFCQHFKSGDSKEDVIETDVENCSSIDIVDGLALLPNWEGEYFGTPMEFGVDLVADSVSYPATLMDSDRDVWCDNVDVDHDSDGNITTTQFCTYNFEFYHLWSLVIPEDLY